MDSAALILLDNPTPCRLAVVWGHVDHKNITAQEERDIQWGKLAGVSHADVRRFGPGLITTAICRSDGTTEELALKFIRSKVMGDIQK